jgi:xanthine dehydrogenase YagT iron-sulfur-binding subunit
MTDETFDPELTDEENQLLDGLSCNNGQDDSSGIPRRDFLKQVLAGSGGLVALQLLDEQTAMGGNLPFPPEKADPPGVENSLKVSFKVNGSQRNLQVDSRMSLLDALREKLGLTGAKKGCDHGQCGACTVISDGQRVLSCLTLAAACEGRTVTTIEGLAKSGKLHAMQQSFIEHDGFQCGFCTPGQICSAVAMLKEAKNGEASYVTADVSAVKVPLELSSDEIKERMSGNICRCGAYRNIVAAIQAVHHESAPAQAWSFVQQDNSTM